MFSIPIAHTDVLGALLLKMKFVILMKRNGIFAIFKQWKVIGPII